MPDTRTLIAPNDGNDFTAELEMHPALGPCLTIRTDDGVVEIRTAHELRALQWAVTKALGFGFQAEAA